MNRETSARTVRCPAAALVAQGDVGYFQSQGFTQGSPYSVAAFTTGVLTGTTAVQFLPSLPAGAIIRDIVVSNTTANAVTGGVVALTPRKMALNICELTS
jgi:hypothetical protein